MKETTFLAGVMMTAFAGGCCAFTVGYFAIIGTIQALFVLPAVLTLAACFATCFRANDKFFQQLSLTSELCPPTKDTSKEPAIPAHSFVD